MNARRILTAALVLVSAAAMGADPEELVALRTAYESAMIKRVEDPYAERIDKLNLGLTAALLRAKTKAQMDGHLDLVLLLDKESQRVKNDRRHVLPSSWDQQPKYFDKATRGCVQLLYRESRRFGIKMD